MRFRLAKLEALTWLAEPGVFRNKGSEPQRHGLRLVLEDERGNQGTGEMSPLPGYSKDNLESAEVAVRELFAHELTLPDDPSAGLRGLSELPNLAGEHAAVFGLEMAYLDLCKQRQPQPLTNTATHDWVSQIMSVTSTEAMPLSALLENGSVEAALSSARKWLTSGRSTFKLKITKAGDQALLLEQLGAIRTSFPPAVRLRVDLSQSLSAADSHFLMELEQYDLEYVEEPFATGTLPAHDSAIAFTAGNLSEELAFVRVPKGLSIAFDESLLDVDQGAAVQQFTSWPDIDWAVLGPDGLRAARLVGSSKLGALKTLVLKPMFLGGIQRCLKWRHLANLLGLNVVISHTFSGKVASSWEAKLAWVIGSKMLAQSVEYQP